MASFSNVFTGAPQDDSLDRFIGQFETVGDLPDAENMVEDSIAYVLGTGFKKVSSGAWVDTSLLSAANILASILTVDGPGSGLNADLLDGEEATAFADASHTHVEADITDLDHDAAIDARVDAAFVEALGIDATSLDSDVATDGHVLTADGAGNAAWEDAGGGAVDSVFTRTGTVVAAASDYDASQIDNDSGVSGAFVDDALDQLDTDKADLAGATFTGPVSYDVDSQMDMPAFELGTPSGAWQRYMYWVVGIATEAIFGSSGTDGTFERLFFGVGNTFNDDGLAIKANGDVVVVSGGTDVTTLDAAGGALFTGDVHLDDGIDLAFDDYLGHIKFRTADGNSTAARLRMSTGGGNALDIVCLYGDVKLTAGSSNIINNISEVQFEKGIRTTPDTGLGTTGTLTLDAQDASLYDIGDLTGDVTFATTNLSAGSTVTARVTNGGTLRTLSFPAGWTFVGTEPTDIAASKAGILTLTSFGTTDSDVVAAWAVEE